MLPGGLPWRRVPFPPRWLVRPRGSLARGPRQLLRARLPLGRTTVVPIPQDMHISVARCGELCDGGPYLGRGALRPLPSAQTRAPCGPGGSPAGWREEPEESSMKYGPAVRRRKLGAELRTLRVQAGLTSGEAARLVGWHQSKVSRIETGQIGGEASDVL